MDLINAIISNCFDKVKELLDKGENPNFQPNYRDTALSIACEKADLAIVELLIKSGASVNVVNNLSEFSPIMVACRRGDIPITSLLINNGAKVNLQSSVIRSACQGGQIAIIEYLIKKGADINSKSGDNGDTALITAVRMNRIDIAMILIKAHANPNLKNMHRHSPLHVAVENNSIEMVRFLLCADANIHAKNYEGKSAIDLALNMNHVEILQLLIEKHHILELCALLMVGVNQDWFYNQIALAQTIVNQRNSIMDCGLKYIRSPLVPYHNCTYSSGDTSITSVKAFNMIHKYHLKKSIAILNEV